MAEEPILQTFFHLACNFRETLEVKDKLTTDKVPKLDRFRNRKSYKKVVQAVHESRNHTESE